MRESLLSRGDSTSVNRSGVPSSVRAHWLSFRHWPRGKSPAFWVDGGGTLYWSTPMIELLNRRAGEALLSDPVFVSAQRARRVSVWVPFASSAAIELKKYSVPFCSVAKLVPGLSAGQTVKPGLPPTIAVVSIWV